MGIRQRVQAIIIQNHKVLFGSGMLNNKEYRHFFIGGGIEEGEIPQEAIIRELKEEANVEGTIIFKFKNESKENHHTFLIDIGSKGVSLGYDPEDEEVNKSFKLRTLQKLEFIPINDYYRFSLIDIEYFKILLEECNYRNYFPDWYNGVGELVKSYIGEENIYFNYLLGITDIDKRKVNICYREAVRAIIYKDNNILMVHSNKGDYKFPGGGINKEENHEETIKREVREETGYIVNKVQDKVGVIVERKLDEYNKKSIFEMVSYYYACEISDEKTIQNLDDYEAELEFSPEWIQLDQAIKINEKILEADNNKNIWVNRDTTVLKELKRNIEHIQEKKQSY